MNIIIQSHLYNLLMVLELDAFTRVSWLRSCIYVDDASVITQIIGFFWFYVRFVG